MGCPSLTARTGTRRRPYVWRCSMSSLVHRGTRSIVQCREASKPPQCALASLRVDGCQFGLLSAASVCVHNPFVLRVLLVKGSQLHLINLCLKTWSDLRQLYGFDTLWLLICVMPEGYVILRKPERPSAC